MKRKIRLIFRLSLIWSFRNYRRRKKSYIIYDKKLNYRKYDAYSDYMKKIDEIMINIIKDSATILEHYKESMSEILTSKSEEMTVTFDKFNSKTYS